MAETVRIRERRRSGWIFANSASSFIVKLTPFPKIQKQAQELMGPAVQKRLDTTWKDGEKPNDMLQLLIDAAPDVERTRPQIVERMMVLNMASIHTTTAVSIHISHARL